MSGSTSSRADRLAGRCAPSSRSPRRDSAGPAHEELARCSPGRRAPRDRTARPRGRATRAARAAASAAATQSGWVSNWPPGGARHQPDAQAARVGADLLRVRARAVRARSRARPGGGSADPLEERRRVAHRARHDELGRQPRHEVAELAAPSDTRPRDGLRPTSPQHAAGMRIEPPPSLACAIGTIPAATAAAEPPLEPPVERSGSTGCAPGRRPCGSVVGQDPELGRVRLADEARSPASRKRRSEPGVLVARPSRARCRKRMPSCMGSPGRVAAEVLDQERHAAEGPVGRLASRAPSRTAGGSRRSARR